ncbi:MAG: glutamine--tRNA ligase/YqeY domain fusion protein [Clostridiales bacterium]|nr:glutamine--tRNA ligase/YqeY domain fusion protein [Clostridiales bacterium]MDO4350616.1 glutamine--tRNA ligase/YqeY domain fusion protein [Eubacteriales bacterium]MDY4009137.1 glutamine--tRNA ligase/YqeY domain fusion protein [Candidatus Limiplasma sp.]
METSATKTNFIWDAVEEDLRSGRYQSVHTRFPPEPNGYLHIGHCKALVADFLTAERFGGVTNLRFDDTNPAKEETEYVDGIMADIRWLGFDWKGGLFFASEYYQQCYDIAVDWIKRGLAYVCELSPEQVREYRGTLTQPGKNSPYRDRPVEESLRLFEEMKAGKHPEGSMILRMKIDMASPNINMRDPAMYRILFKEHHRTGKTWCIYPMYDFAHPIGDALEGITHSLCSLEYEDHRPLYDWVVEHAANMLPSRPRQIEFSRLNLTRTIMSKRYLRMLVEGGYVSGWDDPRMPTLCAMRRRGYTPESIRDFIDRIGVAKADSTVDLALLEHCVREDLGEKAPRAMAVVRPLKVILTNWPEDKRDELDMENHPNHPEMGMHKTVLTREIYIEREDFMEEPPKKYFRLYPGNEVRLKGAYIVKCEGCEKDENSNVTAVLCTVDMNSRNGTEGANRKIKGTLHWVSAEDNVPFEARLYEPLMMDESEAEAAAQAAEADQEAKAEADGEAAPVSSATLKTDFLKKLNPNSLETCRGYAERFLADANVGDTFQFLRMGYFCKDQDSTAELPVFNRVVGLKDSFAKKVK